MFYILIGISIIATNPYFDGDKGVWRLFPIIVTIHFTSIFIFYKRLKLTSNGLYILKNLPFRVIMISTIIFWLVIAAMIVRKQAFG